jgi:hypothetical protein
VGRLDVVVHFGGRESRLIEPPENLKEALRGPLIADPWASEAVPFCKPFRGCGLGVPMTDEEA